MTSGGNHGSRGLARISCKSQDGGKQLARKVRSLEGEVRCEVPRDGSQDIGAVHGMSAPNLYGPGHEHLHHRHEGGRGECDGGDREGV